MMSAASNVAMRWRVARRFEAKDNPIRLLSDYKRAQEELKHGNIDEMLQFCKTALLTIFSDDGHGNGTTVPAWFHGLSTIKRNQIKSLHREMRIFLMNGPGAKDHQSLLNGAQLMASGWHKILVSIEAASQVEDKSLSHGPFTIISMPGLTRAEVEGALEAVSAAASKLNTVFPRVLYGNVYLSGSLKKNVAAWYVHTEDKFYLNVSAKKRFSDVYTIIHELGHRFDHKFFKDKGLRDLFWKLSTRKEFETVNYDVKLRREVAQTLLDYVKTRQAGKPLPILSDVVMLWVETRYTPGSDIKQLNMDYLGGKLSDEKFIAKVMGDEDYKIPTEKLLHGPLSVTKYGATSPTENFAEGFAHYVLGMTMPPELSEIFDKLK